MCIYARRSTSLEVCGGMRVWCFTPNPVREKKFVVGSGRAEVSAGGKGRNVARQLRAWGVPAISKTLTDILGLGTGVVPGDGPGVGPGAESGPGERGGWAWVREGEERIDFFTTDPEINFTGWTKIGKYWRQVLRKGDWWVVAGSSATGWPRGWWEKLMKELKAKGVTVAVDSRGALLREAVAAGADWIKCNLAEAEETTGKEGVDPCLHELSGNGTTGVVVTMGKEGLQARVHGSFLSMRAPKVKVKDTTGAGDVVTAMLVYGEVRGWTMAKTLEKAVKAGSWRVEKDEVVSRGVLRG